MKYCPSGKSMGVMPSFSPHRINIGHVTFPINSSGLGPGGPVRMRTNARNAPSLFAASVMELTSASSTRAGSLYTPCSALFTFSSVLTLSNKGFATGSIFNTKSITASTTANTGTTALYCHPNPSKSPGMRLTLLFIPPAQLSKITPLTHAGFLDATCKAARLPMLFPQSTAGCPTTLSTKSITWSLQNSMQYSVSGWSDAPNPTRSSAYTLLVFESSATVSRYWKLLTPKPWMSTTGLPPSAPLVL
mmetsp:Transcript_4725/g.17474  ORF Transcript_4725/g.17474 Transcript_4725/m.17474 type:complete len:247 (+) Transcript_4725:1225-1965(+)